MRFIAVMLIVGIVVGSVMALDKLYAAELHYQCGEYNDGRAAFKDCGPAISIENPVINTPYKPAASDHQPPRFLPAVVLYDTDNRFITIEVGTTFSYSCKAALDDAQGTIEKATAAGRRLVGLCIPIPTYAAPDLIPTPDGPKASAGNTL